MKKISYPNNMEIYEQIGLNYRFFLNWRHAGFAGYIILIYSLMRTLLKMAESNNKNSFIVSGAGSISGVIFWIIDKRISSLFRVAIIAAANIEKDLDAPGFFYSQEKIGTVPGSHQSYPRIMSHSAVLSILYLGSCVAFFSVFIYDIFAF